MSEDPDGDQIRRQLEQLGANCRALSARQAGHHFLLRALLATHPNRGALRKVLQAETVRLAQQSREAKMPAAMQEAVNEEIVSWLALLA